ncbi:TonB-dependent receptor domain-containing protein [Ichthyenterobacterium magnum]|uniref:Outer membrane receptor protein involved in Fe transport n=1 Tax=Ichthyenterobacterium magnum TaxID=1230530 RepID=A0A420DLY5_9FLAO|nr:TonB-dependent receptor [Ichthyenterobacterium magnum]RKE95220.1 outer membrane receptor protein involved in Fe transport [Ichthyenterobacterium magnum]
MKSFFNIIVLFLTLSTAFAQQNKEAKVTGTVIDKDVNAPLEYATVSFFSKKENKIITGGITDEKGKFNIKVPKGVYNILVEYISYKTQTFQDRNITNDIDLGKVSLALDIESLDAVEVIAERTTVEIKLDKKIYNVGKDLTVRGGTVSDVLDNVPSVSVDVEGNVSLRGNENVRILINGKPSGLVGLNSTDALRQLPAESIEKVEVITSPSARYDAEGTAGILNIILRRSKLQGLNGAITTNVGYNPSAGISGNINYRTGNVNIFNTSGYSYREAPGHINSSRQNFNKDFDDLGNLIADNPDTFLDESSDFDRVRKGFNTNLGIEWYITDSASLTSSIFYRDSDSERNTTNIIEQFDTNRSLLSSSLRLDPELENDKTIFYAINFDKQFKTSGHKLTFDFQYEDSNEDENSLVNIDGINKEKVATLEDQTRILLQTDYVLPIGEKSQFEMGYRGNFNKQSTDYTVEFLDSNTNQFVVDNGLTNLFNYKEYLTAVYTQYGSKIGDKFSYLLGLRMENTQITLDQPTTGAFKKKNYTGLFPTVNLNYELSKSENITLAYNRRLRRPRSFFINPFPSRSSITSVFQGNPDLDPSYSGQFDLGYLKRFGKFTFDTSAYYSHATDVFNFISLDTGETVIVNGIEENVINRTPINLATQDRIGFEFTLAYRASKKWNINANFNFFQSETEGITPSGLDLANKNSSWFVRLNNKYTLPGNIDWQTRLFYNGPRSEDSQNDRDALFSTTLAFSKDLFKDKASIAFNVNDVFNSRKRNQTTTTPTFTSESEFQWRERSFNLSFTYRFNQKKKRQRGNRSDDFDFEG